MPIRAGSWDHLSDKTKRTYAATWGGMDAARERYEADQPMHRPAGRQHDHDHDVASVTARAVAGGVTVEVVHKPVSRRYGGQLTVTERVDRYFYGADVDQAPPWLRPLIDMLSQEPAQERLEGAQEGGEAVETP